MAVNYEVHVSGQWENVCVSFFPSTLVYERKFSIRFDKRIPKMPVRKSWEKLFSIISIGWQTKTLKGKIA